CDGERYFIRLILLHQRGLKGFEDLKTHNGVTYDSYCLAAAACGLLACHEHYADCLQEASLWMMGAVFDIINALTLYKLSKQLAQNSKMFEEVGLDPIDQTLWPLFKRGLGPSGRMTIDPKASFEAGFVSSTDKQRFIFGSVVGMSNSGSIGMDISMVQVELIKHIY
ncbi:hypothetical protein MJO28_007727, partial [Puccinia striiformis f. sp. tritici]